MAIKIWRGKKRLAIKLGSHKPDHIEMMVWAMSIKPGDYINTCGGCNRQVAEIEPRWENEGHWSRSKPNKTWVLFEVGFTDVRGQYHICPGGGCAGPKYSLDELMIEKMFLYGNEQRIAEAKVGGWWDERHDRIYQAIKSGKPIFDEFGEFLPQFDCVERG